MVRGYQGEKMERNDEVMACVSICLYGAIEAGRDYNTVDMSRNRMLMNIFLLIKQQQKLVLVAL